MAQINLTTTKPVKLKTQEKYCEEDIEIIPNLQEKTIKPTTEKQEVLVDEGFSGINKLTVDPVNVGSKTFTENGEYSASENGVDGWNKITIDVGGSSEVDLLLPEEFSNVTSIYWFKINDNELLISAPNTTIGLWRCEIDSQNFQKIFDGGYYNEFKNIDSDILFSSSNTNGFYCYNIVNKNVVTITNESRGYLGRVFQNVGDGKYISTSIQKLVCYNHNTKTIISEYTSSDYINDRSYLNGFQPVGEDYLSYGTTNVDYQYVYSPDGDILKKCTAAVRNSSSTNESNITVHKVSDTLYLLGGGATSTFLYNSVIKDVTNVWNYGSLSNKYVNFENKTLIQNSNRVAIFNLDDLTVVEIFNDFGSSLYIGKCGETKCVITSSSTSYQGVRIYRSTDNTYTQLSTSGVYNTIIPTKKGCLYLGSNSSYKGLFYVDEETETITEKLANVTSSYFKVLYQNPFGIFFGNTSSSIVGIYLFNEDTAELIQKYNQSYGYGNTNYPSCPTPNGILSFGYNGQIVYIDNNSADVVEVFKTTNGYCILALIDGEKYYFGNSGNYGVCMVDLSTMSGELLYNTGIFMSVAQKTQSGIYFVCDYRTSNTDTAGILYYDYNTCEQIYDKGYYNTIRETGDKVIIENISTATSFSYRLKVKFNPQTREKQVYYKLGEI